MSPRSSLLKLFLLFVLLILATGAKLSAQNQLRSLKELTADTSGWTFFKDRIKVAKNKIEILPADPTKAKEAIYQTQVTTHSIMGAIIYFTGGILVDNGWIRILGSGNEKLNRSLPLWNKGKSFNELGEQPKFLLIADDAIGGFFAINGGAFGKDFGMVYYLAPDRLKWEAQNIGYSDFIDFCLAGNLNKYYNGLRWKAWQTDISKITGNDGFFVYPFLWSVEGKNIESDIRNIVPVQELYDLEVGKLEEGYK